MFVVSIALPVRAANPSFDSFRQDPGFLVSQPYIYLVRTNTGGTNVFNGVTNIFINSTISNTGSTIINSNTTSFFANGTITITNTTVNIDNSSLTINGTNVPVVNPTIGRYPYKDGPSSLGDGAFYFIDTNTAGIDTLADNTLIVTNISGGGVLYGKTFGMTSGYVTNLPNALGILTNDGTGNLGWFSLTSGPWEITTNSVYVSGYNAISSTPVLINTNYGTLFVGPGAFTNWINNGFPLQGNEVLISAHDPNVAGPAKSSTINFIDYDVGYANHAIFQMGTDVATPMTFMGWEINETGGPTLHRFNVNLPGDFSAPLMQYTISGTPKFYVNPWEPDGTSPYRLGTRSSHTNGNLLEVSNDSTNLLSVNYAGGLVFGPGATNVLYRSGPQLVYTNGSTTVNGVTMALVNGNGHRAIVGIDQNENAILEAPSSDNVALSPNSGSMSYFASSTAFWPSSGTPRLGLSGTNSGWSIINTTGYIEATESSDPAAPTSPAASRLYTRDNGGGKAQLVVRFPTGAIQVIATEP